MSNKSKHHTKGAFGGLRGKRKRAQVRYLASRGKNMEAPSLPGSRIKVKGIMDEPTSHVTDRAEEAKPPQN